MASSIPAGKPARWQIIIGVVVLVLLALAVVLEAWLLVDLPTLDDLESGLVTPSTKILARDGRLLYEITDPAGRNHTTVSLDEVPDACVQAVVATEDANYYSHPGVDVVGILRALWINVQGGETLAGGSTITQQVARNVLLSAEERSERTLTRKLRESILAWRLSQAYSKDEVLALYLNQTYFGHLAYGIEAAARTYFGVPVSQLDLAQCALLAGLPQAPGLYDPLLNPEAAQARQAVVLGLMAKQDYIGQAQAQLAASQTLNFSSDPFPIEAPHFVFGVWQTLEQTLTPEQLYGGLVVTTTLDLDLTKRAEEIVAGQLERLADDDLPHNAGNAALVAMDVSTGQVLAYVGSSDYFNVETSGAIDMARALRQPGSTLKPFTYALSFDPRRCVEIDTGESPCPWTPATMLLDVRTSFVTYEGRSYVPQNYDRRYHGPVRAREALAGSLNVPAVLALDEVGVPALLDLADRLGLDTLTDAGRYGLALTLGGGEVRLLDLTAAYATLPRAGVYLPPSTILAIETADGEVLYDWRPPDTEAVIEPRIAYLITDILSDNAARTATYGEFSRLNIGRPAAVKTGTTTDFRDNWTVGYTPALVVGVWVGNADYTPMRYLSGVDGATPIWHSFMREALVGKPERDFEEPAGLVRAEVCALSGLLPTDACPQTADELFLGGTVPTEADTLYQVFTIDTATGLLADANTPADRRAPQVFLVLPPEAEAWGREVGIPAPPAATLSNEGDTVLRLVSPDPMTVYRMSAVLPGDAQRVPLRLLAPGDAQEVRFRVDGAVFGLLTEPPWEWWWPLQPGQHEVSADVRLVDLGWVTVEPVRFVVLPAEDED